MTWALIQEKPTAISTRQIVELRDVVMHFGNKTRNPEASWKPNKRRATVDRGGAGFCRREARRKQS